MECNAINLGQGLISPMSSELTDLVAKAMRDGITNMHMNGSALLRERIAEKCAKLYGAKLALIPKLRLHPEALYGIYTASTTIISIPGRKRTFRLIVIFPT